MSVISYLRMASRSMPKPKAQPVYFSLSMPTASKTLGMASAAAQPLLNGHLSALAVAAVVVKRNDHERLDDGPGIVRLHNDDSASANRDHLRMPDGQRPPVCQAHRKWLERPML